MSVSHESITRFPLIVSRPIYNSTRILYCGKAVIDGAAVIVNCLLGGIINGVIIVNGAAVQNVAVVANLSSVADIARSVIVKDTSGSSRNSADVYDGAAVIKSAANADTAPIVDRTSIVSKAGTANRGATVVINYAGGIVVEGCTQGILYGTCRCGC